jgi:hypothetical protein
MWKREASVNELVKQLDRYTERKDWDNLTREERLNLLQKGEWEAVKEQQHWCTQDFTYAARNYFWITDNNGQDMLLDLWEAQYLILQLWYDLKTQGRPQKIYIIKGRQVGASVLVEAMIAWSTIFFPNTEALVVSVDQPHASYLFSLMLHIYDRLPWWMKPELASREEKDGLWFDRKDPEKRATKPGLNSHIYVQWSTQYSGVGQGRKILALHGSEITDWYQPRARTIIESDLGHALKDTPRAFGFLETTGKEAGSYSHRLWRKCENMAELADWYPLFIPWFFEPSRRRTITFGWVPKKPELSMRERIKGEWVRCAECGRYTGASQHGVSRGGTHCPFCKTGMLAPVVLTDEQLFWKEAKRRNAEGTDSESYKEHLQELASTAEEAFQLHGLAVFGVVCQERVNATIRDPEKFPGVKVGYFDHYKQFHGLDGSRPTVDNEGATAYRCYRESCNVNHMADLEDFNVTIWEEPQEGCSYSVGVDIAEGIGQDYSVIFVNKFGGFALPDEQVAVLRDNHMEPMDLAFYCDLIGHWYNDALMCIEYNGIGKVCADHVLRTYDYPNIFRWKHMDSVHVQSNKFHWYTKPDTREKLWQTARKWIKAGSWVIRSKNFLAEMQDFQKDEDDSKSAGHSDGGHDDELMSGMIALYAGHEGEADERGTIRCPMVEDVVSVPRFQMICNACQHEWGASNPEYNSQCPKCYSHQVIGKPLEIFDNRATVGEVGFNQDGSIVLSSGRGINYSPDRLTGDML